MNLCFGSNWWNQAAFTFNMGALDGVVLFVPSARAHLDVGDSQMLAEVVCVRADISGLATTGVHDTTRTVV